MPASRFREVLPLLNKGNKQVGVCAMGPVGDGDEIIWMRVWVWQQNGNKLAAAAGNAGEGVGADRGLRAKDNPPFKRPNQWMVQTKREPQSAAFNVNKPAHVQAMALIENGNERRIEHWNQAVALKPEY
jgi:hypothetical protein